MLNKEAWLAPQLLPEPEPEKPALELEPAPDDPDRKLN
jgi:hypothetical protein